MAFTNLIDPRAALRVCVDATAGGRISGSIFSQRLTRSIPFSDIGDLLVRIDSVLDKQNFPQAFQRARTFLPSETDLPISDALEGGMPEELVFSARGGICTFSLTILSRRSASWQGRVDWLDGSEPQAFESALEFVKLTEAHIFQAR